MSDGVALRCMEQPAAAAGWPERVQIEAKTEPLEEREDYKELGCCRRCRLRAGKDGLGGEDPKAWLEKS